MLQSQVEELLFRISMCYQSGVDSRPDAIENNTRKLKSYLEAHPGNFELYYASVIIFKPDGLGRLLAGENFGVLVKVEIGFSTFCTEHNEVHFVTFTVLSMKMAEDDPAFVLARKLEEILHG